MIWRSSPIVPDATALGEHPRLRMMPVHEAFHQHEPVAPRELEDRLDLAGATRERLLAENVLSRLERKRRPLNVERVRQRDVDRVDLVVREQRVVAPVRAPDPVRTRVRVGPRSVAAGDGNDVHRVRPHHSGEDRVVDPRGREQTESDRTSAQRPVASSRRRESVSIVTASSRMTPVVISFVEAE